MDSRLSRVLECDEVRLEPLEDRHLPELKEACNSDREVWRIYPLDLSAEGFDSGMVMIRSFPDWVRFAVIEAASGRVVGMTSYIRPTIFGVVEIGGTFIAPTVRGSGLNRAMKALLIGNAFANGFVKVEFRVDTRNARSMAAVEKLGATREGVLRQDMVTWTGYRRDTAVFGLLQDEWAG